MKQRLYKLMDWPKIEAICYAEEDQPQKVLGAHVVGSATLYQTFLPGATKVDVVLEREDKNVPMGMVDEEGFFAAVVSGKTKQPYHYVVTDEDGKSYIYKDPYQFDVSLSDEESDLLNRGLHYHSYDVLGAHFCTIDGTDGVVFRVWAPNAIRVSVVGDFNNWDGRRNPMIRHEQTGIFMLFIPGLKAGMNYKYEIRAKGENVFLKADPYGFYSEKEPGTSSVVCDKLNFEWNDADWLKERESFDRDQSLLSIYEINLNVFKDDDGNNIPLKTIAKDLIPYVKKMKYTHIELMPVMQYADEYWNGYQTTGYYSFCSKYGTREEFMSFVDSFHVAGIGVIIDWVPSYFAKDAHGLSSFDGTYLYGHLDVRQRENVAYDAYNFNYCRPQVSNYLLANSVYWLEEFHVDGFRISGLSSMLYMDYGKAALQWVPNIYGGNENLDAVEFVKHFNSMIHKNYKGIITIAKETSAWPNITRDVEMNGLGFDFVWNTGFTNQMISCIQKNAEERKYALDDVTACMSYAFNESYILPVSHNEIYRNGGSLLECMQVDKNKRLPFLRMILSYYMCSPGRKMFYMIDEADEMLEKLQSLYQQLPAFSVYDGIQDGFEWVYRNENKDGVLCFARKGEYFEDTLLVVANFSEDNYKEYRISAPFEGQYQEIFNSNQKEFGGTAVLKENEYSTEEECHSRDYSLHLNILPLSVSVYSYRPFTKKELLAIAEKKVELIRAQLEAEALEKAKQLNKKKTKPAVKKERAATRKPAAE